MNPLKHGLLSAYYLATLPARRRAAIDRAARQTEPVRVLFYHRVADRDSNPWTMSRAEFAAQLRWLRARFDLVDLAEAQRRIAAGQNRRPTACITFDDGYAENLEFALPLLIREQVSRINVCLFCMDIARSFLMKGSMNEAKFEALDQYATSPLFTEAEGAALDYATRLTKEKKVDRETFDRLSLHYSERAICEIVWVVASEQSTI